MATDTLTTLDESARMIHALSTFNMTFSPESTKGIALSQPLDVTLPTTKLADSVLATRFGSISKQTTSATPESPVPTATASATAATASDVAASAPVDPERAKRARQLVIDMYIAEATDPETKKISAEKQAALDEKMIMLKHVSDGQLVEKTDTLLEYADKNRDSMRSLAQKSLDELKAGTFEVNGIKVKAIEDKEALARIEGHNPTEEDRKKYHSYITAFEDASKILESANKGNDQEIIARAAKLDQMAQQKKDEEFFAGTAKAVGLVSEELAKVIEMLSPWLAQMMGNKANVAKVPEVEVDILPQDVALANAQNGVPPSAPSAQVTSNASNTVGSPPPATASTGKTNDNPSPVVVAANDAPTKDSKDKPRESTPNAEPNSKTDYGLSSPSGGTGLKLKGGGGLGGLGFTMPERRTPIQLSGDSTMNDVTPPPAASAASAASSKAR